MIKLLWDFFGPDSKEVAHHHAIHLKQYAEKNNVNPFETGIDDFEGTSSAWIVVEEEFMLKIRDELKPKRGIRVN